ncbi:MAG: indole-3-glycerol-phosphate synthase [Opitutales bacterium]|nr:indole-3-glycerol-phosphate synthase [Opitutales bacterium]MCH8539627.1 indole-3-glycerol phosphate synthase TrpC [Opitutales bacterium]
MQILDQILQDVRQNLARAKQENPLPDLQQKIKETPPARSLCDVLAREGFGLIAEIKACSPSMGTMRPENVSAAPAAYHQSTAVRAFSILTNQTFFGQDLGYLKKIRQRTDKPILRKDFIIDPYQVYEARAAGADALLLMANILSPKEMKTLYNLTTDLGMEALCEVHSPEEIQALPENAALVGINARKFKSENSAETFARSRQQDEGHREDFTIHFDAFSLFPELPSQAFKVAESGMNAGNLCETLRQYPFDAALVGTSLLQNPQGVAAELAAFEKAIEKLAKTSPIK